MNMMNMMTYQILRTVHNTLSAKTINVIFKSVSDTRVDDVQTTKISNSKDFVIKCHRVLQFYKIYATNKLHIFVDRKYMYLLTSATCFRIFCYLQRRHSGTIGRSSKTSRPLNCSRRNKHYIS
jgi:hypothetical protein